MENLDLDINNYSIKDIEQFFKLKPNSKYTASDIELKEYNIRETLLNSGHVNKRFKTNLIEFLRLAKQWLIFVKCEKEPVPTTIPKNWQLDKLDTPLSKEPLSRTEELINRPETQYIYTHNSDFLPGKINPLNTRIITKCLNVDTRFRDNLYNTQSSDFTIQLPTKFNKIVSMQLSAIELPISFYGISSNYGNNFIHIDVNYELCCKTTECNMLAELNMSCGKTFIIPDGNYTASDLIDTLNFMLLTPKSTSNKTEGQLEEGTSPDDSIQNEVFSCLQFTVDIKSTGSGSRKVSIGLKPDYFLNDADNNNVVINSITMDFTKNKEGIPDTANLSTKLGWNLGFTKPIYCGEIFYIAETIIEPTTKYIFLAVDDFNNSSNNHFVSAFNQSVLNGDILARISVKGSNINVITENDYNLVTEPRHYFGPVDIQRLRVRLFDEFGRILSMNNSNYSFCLSLKMLYDL